MSDGGLISLSLALFSVALLYSSVGHAGASGYIAVMSLAGLAAADVRVTALSLNIIVGIIASLQFARAGHFRFALFWPFALPAIPFAFLGGAIHVSPQVFQALLGVLLLLSAGYFFFRPQEKMSIVAPSIVASLLAGAVIGFLSGVTGTGGGIFLTPLLVLAAWASSKQAAAVSAVFILCNSVAGLAGLIAAKGVAPDFFWQFGAAVVIGGLVGSGLGANRFHAPTIKRLLAAVLVVAGMKLLLL